MEPLSLENQLFDWEQWDEMNVSEFIFYDVTLKVPIGEFKVGQKFHSVYWNGTRSTITFFEEDQIEHNFDLKVSVGKKIVESF